MSEQPTGYTTNTQQSRVKKTTQQTKQQNTAEDRSVRVVPQGAIDLITPRNRTQYTTATNTALADVEDDLEDDDTWQQRLPSSAINYQRVKQPAKPLPPGEYLINGRRVIVTDPFVVSPRRKTALNPGAADHRTQRTPPPVLAEEPLPRRGRTHWLLIFGIGMIFMLALWQAGTSALNWWTTKQQDAAFGRPRTYQFDAIVGHNDSAAYPTHFILINLNRHVEIYEEPGGDGAKTIIYTGPTLFGDSQDLTPVLGRVAVLTKGGKPDLIIYIQDQRLIYFNDGTKFVPATPTQMQSIHNLPPPPSV